MNIKCTDCGQTVEPLDVFPQNRCLDCHATAWDKQTESQKLQAFDNMVKTFQGRR